MASIRAKAPLPVGSAQWIEVERTQAQEFIVQETEDFSFSVRNEMDWLNEHMADIFGNSQLNMTELLKTPGRLRGKTPRTARKRNPLENRAPLTDLFTANAMLPVSGINTLSTLTHAPTFKVAEDDLTFQEVIKKQKGTPRKGKENVDSGYHGLTEDEMDIDPTQVYEHPCSSPQKNKSSVKAPVAHLREQHKDTSSTDSEGLHTTENSFHSAQEEMGQSTTNAQSLPSPDVAPAEVPDVKAFEESENEKPELTADQGVNEVAHPKSHVNDFDVHMGTDDMDDAKMEDVATPSEGSSPVRPLIRKSSLNFASLPAREPLTSKTSIGTRVSRTSHVDISKASIPNRGSYFGRSTGGKSLGARLADTASSEDKMEIDQEDQEQSKAVEFDPDSKLKTIHNKTSTQRLHERINMLGQSQTARSTKSLVSAATQHGQPAYPDLTTTDKPDHTVTKQESATIDTEMSPIEVEDDDDWIPMGPPTTQTPPQMTKSHSADVMEQIHGKESISGAQVGLTEAEKLSLPKWLSPLRQSHATMHTEVNVEHSTSEMSPRRRIANQDAENFLNRADMTALLSQVSTTPAGSPMAKRQMDGPLSASKAKLSSILKSAKGIFASSAGISAQAKMETLSPRSQYRHGDGLGSIADVLSSNKGESDVASLYPVLLDLKTGDAKPLRAQGPPSTTRRTRSSTEREERQKAEELKEKEKLESDLEKNKEKESQKIDIHTLEKERVADAEKAYLAQKERERNAKSVQEKSRGTEGRLDPKGSTLTQERGNKENDQPEGSTGVSRPASRLQGQQSLKQKEVRRPVKPAKEVQTKLRPVPVSIRVGTASQRELDNRKIHPSNTSLASNLQDSLAPSSSKGPGLSNKASSGSLHTLSSTNSFKSSVSSTTSAKPKALAAAARKKEQDEREAQRKLEQKREIERRRAAQEEERRQEQARKEEQRQREQARAAAAEEARKAAQRQALEKRKLENAKKLEQQNMAASRAQHGNETAQSLHQDRSHPSQARPQTGGRPPTRMQELGRPGFQPQVNPAKPPKRTLQNEIIDESNQRPPPPATSRPGTSYQQNDHKRRKTEEEEFEDEYEEPRPRGLAPLPVRHSAIRKDGPNKSIFAHGYTNAAPPQPMIQGSSSLLKTTTMNQHHLQQLKPTHPMEMAKISNAKIQFAEAANPPHQSHKTPARVPTLAPPAKSSPQYPNGDNVSLPDIATDSEDEEDSNDFAPPSWANSPELRTLLSQQQLMDPEQVFGPIAPLQMEEIFKNKDRHHRFRARTSSANWSGQDRLTEEEIRRDMEARERLKREGGWTYGL